MNHRSNNSSIDWQELDRLVDGRLSQDEYRQLLIQIDADPNGWKQCAMAFLEHQALEKELTAFAKDPDSMMLPCMGSIVAESQSSHAPLSTKVGLAAKPQARSSTSILGWMTMALCIVGGSVMGYTLNSSFRDSLPSQSPPGLIGDGVMGTVDHDSAQPNEQPLVVKPSADAPVHAKEQPGQAEEHPGQAKDQQKSGKKKGCSSKKSCCSQKNRSSLQNRRENMRQHDPTEYCPQGFCGSMDYSPE